MRYCYCLLQARLWICSTVRYGTREDCALTCSWAVCYFVELLTLKWPYLMNVFCYWIAESTTPIQTTYMSSEDLDVEGYMYVLDVQAICVPDSFSFAFCTGFSQTLAGHSVVKYTVTLSNDAVAFFCRFIYPSDAGMGEQDCSRAAICSKMRVVMKLAVWVLVRNWSGMKMVDE